MDPGRPSGGGPFTFECLLNDMRLGTGTRAAKKDAKHAAARDAFCKILRAGGYETDVNLGKLDGILGDTAISLHILPTTTLF